MTDAPREITVEELDEFRETFRFAIAAHPRSHQIMLDRVCALARRALSQESLAWHGHLQQKPNYQPLPGTPQSVPTCTCSKHPLWDGYDGDCPIHGWFEPVAPDTPQSVPAEEITIEGERYRWNKSEKLWVICTPDAPLSQGGELADYLDHMTDREIGSSRDREKLSEAAALIASLIAERDKLKEERDTIWALRGEIVTQRDDLVERVSVLEGALTEASALIANLERDWCIDNVMYDGRPVDGWCNKYRALTRTSEEA
jgi:hypothetical protein